MGGCLFVYLIHIIATLILWKYIKTDKDVKNKKNEIVLGKTFWIYFIFVCLFLLPYIFETIRRAEIFGDSAFFWFVKGWIFYNVQDIYGFLYLFEPSYPLLIPLIYNFFIQMNCGLGIAGYTALLFFGAILLTLIEGWIKTGKYSIILGIPICVFLPIFFRHHISESYADIPLSFVYYIALLTVADTLFKKRSSYAPMILLAAIPMIKSNGEYLILLCFIVSLIFIFLEKIDKPVSVLFKLFGLPIGLIVADKIIMRLFNIDTFITKVPFNVLKSEIIYTTNPLLSYWNKLLPSIKYFYELTTSTPSFSILLTPLVVLFVYFIFKPKKEGFLLFNIISVILSTVCIIYVMIEDAWRKWWFDFGYWYNDREKLDQNLG